jgi:tetratricopeptide (TPR) repeat protein
MYRFFVIVHHTMLIHVIQYVEAKNAYERVVADNPFHAKVLQQLGWLYHQDGSSFQNQDLAINYLTKSLEAGMLYSLIVLVVALIPVFRLRRRPELVSSRTGLHGWPQIQ